MAGLWRLGNWNYSIQERLTFVKSCVEMGITTFDQADIYGDYTSEALFGEALALDPGLRPHIEIVSKCGIKLVSDKHPSHQIGHYDTGAAHIRRSVESSLRKLGTDYLDLLLIHRPDALLDPDNVAAAFEELRTAGLVRHVGVSNFSPSQFDLLQSRLSFPLVTNQVECSVMNFEVMHDGTLDQAMRLERAPMAWSVLGGGRLFHHGLAQADRIRQVLAEIGQEMGNAAIDQVAIAWLLRHPARLLPVLGTGNLDRVRGAVDACNLPMDRQQWYRVWRASKGHDVP